MVLDAVVKTTNTTYSKLRKNKNERKWFLLYRNSWAHKPTTSSFRCSVHCSLLLWPSLTLICRSLALDSWARERQNEFVVWSCILDLTAFDANNCPFASLFNCERFVVNAYLLLKQLFGLISNNGGKFLCNISWPHLTKLTFACTHPTGGKYCK